MEILRRIDSGAQNSRNEDAPMDLTKTGHVPHMAHNLSLFTDNTQSVIKELSSVTEKETRYIPIPKKRQYIADHGLSEISSERQHKRARLEGLVDRVKAEVVSPPVIEKSDSSNRLNVKLPKDNSSGDSKIDISSPTNSFQKSSNESQIDERLRLQEMLKQHKDYTSKMEELRKQQYLGFTHPSLPNLPTNPQNHLAMMQHFAHMNMRNYLSPPPIPPPSPHLPLDPQSIITAINQQALYINWFNQLLQNASLIESQVRLENERKKILESQNWEHFKMQFSDQLAHHQHPSTLSNKIFSHANSPPVLPPGLAGSQESSRMSFTSSNPTSPIVKEFKFKETSPESIFPSMVNNSQRRDIKESLQNQRDSSFSPAASSQASATSSPVSSAPTSSTALFNEDTHSRSSPISLDFDDTGGIRRRAPRALTGKHVRPGTGASPSTLLTLKQKLANRITQSGPSTKSPTKSKKSKLK